MTRGVQAKITVGEIYEAIKRDPGMTRVELTKKTGVPKGSIESRLASLNSQGYLIYEDNYGRIYPYT